MGLWESITGRSRPKRANLDALFLVPSAAITLQTAAGLNPTGDGSICFRAAAGAGFHEAQDEVVALLEGAADAPTVQTSTDSYGFTWLQVHRGPDDGGWVPVIVPARRPADPVLGATTPADRAPHLARSAERGTVRQPRYLPRQK